jgi:hypothetical protein
MDFTEKYTTTAEAGKEENKDKVTISNEYYALCEVIQALTRELQRVKT